MHLPLTHDELRIFFGPNDANLRLIRDEFRVKLVARHQRLIIEGDEPNVDRAVNILERMLSAIDHGKASLADEMALLVELADESEESGAPEIIYTERRKIEPRTDGQRRYLAALREHALVFGIGPAGTGKTYMAVAYAVQALRRGLVQRIVLTRPAVEAGENLGFLPGDMREKVDPYLRPIYDALDDMLTKRQLAHYTETGVIEVAPLAFMRGRTLSRAFVILDEAQNTTPAQMKMLLTRLGAQSRAVITGDITQVDLSGARKSGLHHAVTILHEIGDIGIVRLSGADIVRHKLVRAIVDAYELDEQRQAEVAPIGDVLDE